MLGRLSDLTVTLPSGLDNKGSTVFTDPIFHNVQQFSLTKPYEKWNTDNPRKTKTNTMFSPH